MRKGFSVLLLCTVLPLGSSLAHSGAHPARYVAESGTDQGACNTPAEPCRSISYAVNQSGKGDKVFVAKGTYRVESLDAFYLLSDMVIVEGGFDAQSAFKKHDPSKHESVIIGLPAEYREQLAKRGFRLIQDQKAVIDSNTKNQLKQLATYQKITAKKQSNVACINGMAGEFPCTGIDMVAHMPLATFSSNPTSANDIWGFVDLNDNREYAIIGLRNGTAVVDVTDGQNPIEIGTVSGLESGWRDVKVLQTYNANAERYQAYAYVSTEASGGGIQIIDLTQLPERISLVNTLQTLSSSHNVYMANTDYQTGVPLEGLNPYLYIAGANVGGGAFRAYDLTDPVNPSVVATPSTGYIHDGTSLVITDARTAQCKNGHNPCELFIDFNENTVDIWDVTDKNDLTRLSSTSYSRASYTHSGWWSQDKNYIFIQDEGDEQDFGVNTTLNVLDISDLTSPMAVGTYVGQTRAIDHNGFTLGDKYYMSNYRRGLSILDVSDPINPTDRAFFDTFPVPESNSANFNGAWGTYPYLPSGNILVSDIEYGLFVLKENGDVMGEDNSSEPVTPPDSGKKDSGGSIGFLALLILLAFSTRKLVNRKWGRLPYCKR